LWISYGCQLFGATDDEDENPLLGLFKNLYNQSIAVLGTVESIKFAFAKHVLSFTFKNMNLFHGYLPSIDDIIEHGKLIKDTNWTGTFTCEGEKYNGKHEIEFTINTTELEVKVEGCDNGFNDHNGTARIISANEIELTWSDIEDNKIKATLKKNEEEWKGTWKCENPGFWGEANHGEIIVKRKES